MESDSWEKLMTRVESFAKTTIIWLSSVQGMTLRVLQ